MLYANPKGPVLGMDVKSVGKSLNAVKSGDAYQEDSQQPGVRALVLRPLHFAGSRPTESFYDVCRCGVETGGLKRGANSIIPKDVSTGWARDSILDSCGFMLVVFWWIITTCLAKEILKIL